ncbi:MAG: DNA internalization-related competence protein ComEC/Rec2, partial [Gammaproteobacteria bacterium]|nr:DNA internalization-related competence protein ComEC/Rec2 [Gammaproteobacteria bacterium]
DVIPSAWEGRALQVSGFPCGIPVGLEDGRVRVDFCVRRLHGPELPEDHPMMGKVQRIRVTLRQAERFGLQGPARLEVTLKRPVGPINPGGWRLDTWAFRHSIWGMGQGHEISDLEDGATGDLCSLSCRYHALRVQAAQSLQAHFAGFPHYAYIEALLLGERGQLTDADWDLLGATGTAHLLAISGLHVGLFAAFCLMLFHPVIVRVLGPRWPPGRVRACTLILTGGATLGFALLAGFTVPTRRALIMLCVAGFFWWRAKPFRWMTPWWVALTLVLIMDPRAPLDLGFWLSFGAVALLMLTYLGRARPAGFWSGLVLAQLAISGGFLPLMALSGLSSPLVGLPANLLAIPYVSIILMPALFVGVPLSMLLVNVGAGAAAEGIKGLLDMLVAGLVAGLQYAAQSCAVDLVDVLPWLGLSALMLLLCVLPLGWLWRLGVMGWCTLSLLMMARASPMPVNQTVTHPEVWIFDVGQGTAALVRSGAHALLYDTGPGYPDGGSAMENILLPSLRALGVRHLDRVIISHGDRDHAGGIQPLMAALKVDAWVGGEIQRVRKLQPLARDCREVPPWRMGELSLSVWQSPKVTSGNEASCVLRVEGPGGSVLLPGDIGRMAEWDWLKSPQRGPVTYLVAGHHGSRSSSGPGFIKHVAPAWVIYTTGYRNRFGHPHPDVVARFVTQGTQALNTATHGAIRIPLQAANEGPVWLRGQPPFWVLPSWMLTGEPIGP